MGLSNKLVTHSHVTAIEKLSEWRKKKLGIAVLCLKKKNSNKPIEIKVKLTAPFAPAVNHQLPTPC